VALPPRGEKTGTYSIEGWIGGRVGLKDSEKLFLEYSFEYCTCIYADVLQVSSFLEILR
jgi:hypothetical protein